MSWLGDQQVDLEEFVRDMPGFEPVLRPLMDTKRTSRLREVMQMAGGWIRRADPIQTDGTWGKRIVSRRVRALENEVYALRRQLDDACRFPDHGRDAEVLGLRDEVTRLRAQVEVLERLVQPRGSQGHRNEQDDDPYDSSSRDGSRRKKRRAAGPPQHGDPPSHGQYPPHDDGGGYGGDGGAGGMVA